MSDQSTLKTTPLHAEHARLGRNMIGFSGWDIDQDVTVENRSDEYAGLAVQGPRAPAWFDAFVAGKSDAPARNHIVRLEIDGVPILIARTGYTGEDGFELFAPAENAVKLF